jgi:hypothetical protein
MTTTGLFTPEAWSAERHLLRVHPVVPRAVGRHTFAAAQATRLPQLRQTPRGSER